MESSLRTLDDRSLRECLMFCDNINWKKKPTDSCFSVRLGRN